MSELCQVLNVSRSAYYDWGSPRARLRQRQDEQLSPSIEQIFNDHQRRYGARRIEAELKSCTPPGDLPRCGRRRVARLMAEMGLKAIGPKSFKPRTTDSRHQLGYSSNLILELPPLDTINQLWVADISYIPLIDQKFLYLALVMDRYSRRIIGWDLQDHMREPLVFAAFSAAIRLRQPPPGVIHHSDRGGQYAGSAYRRAMHRARMRQSMNRADSCYDNAFIESCFGTIKTELQMKAYAHANSAHHEIRDYIGYYNTRRRHSSLDYLAPEVFEQISKNGSTHPARSDCGGYPESPRHPIVR